MDTDIAPTSLASGRTVPIGAECGGGVHDTPPGCAWQHGHEEYVWTPVWFTTSPHHGLVWSYLRLRALPKRCINVTDPGWTLARGSPRVTALVTSYCPIVVRLIVWTVAVRSWDAAIQYRKGIGTETTHWRVGTQGRTHVTR